MIMADQDYDGSHIKGLLLNFLHWYNPTLLKVEGFVKEFVTPIVKCTRGKQSILFHTVPEYEERKDRQPRQRRRADADEGARVEHQVLQGLGTSTAKEAKQYFASLDTNVIPFRWVDGDDRFMRLAFAKEGADERKRWISAVKEGTHVDFSVKEMKYVDFFNKEFVLFSQASVKRAIPSLVDGLKPSQRKVLFACFKRRLTKEIKVAQLAGYVSEHAAYHHGEASLMGTIVGMAQQFVGSNNLNLLYPGGQFGTRLQGGRDSASRVSSPGSPRWRAPSSTRRTTPSWSISTTTGCPWSPSTTAPSFLWCSSTGARASAGRSGEVPNHDPRDVIAAIRRRLAAPGRRQPPPGGDRLEPWYRGFEGTIEAEAPGRKGTKRRRGAVLRREGRRGGVEPGPGGKILISELPVGMWTQKFKEHLETLSETTKQVAAEKKAKAKGKKAKKKAADAIAKKPHVQLVVDYEENHTDTTVSFEVTLAPGIDYGEELSNPKFVMTSRCRQDLHGQHDARAARAPAPGGGRQPRGRGGGARVRRGGPAGAAFPQLGRRRAHRGGRDQAGPPRPS